MQSSHAATKVDVAFDDPNLIADAGLVAVVALAERVGLPDLVTDRVRIVAAANSGGANAAAKVMSLLAGMVAGGDSITDTDRLRHAGMDGVFDGVRAPSTVGTFLRSFTHGHVRQLHSVHRQVLTELAGRQACCRARTCWHSWMSTPPTGRSTATPSRVLRWADCPGPGRCTRCWPPCPHRSLAR
jgi:hypothetical protein